jgi:hypothetical protein
MKPLLFSLALLLLGLLALSASALASSEDEPPSIEPATDANSQDYTDSLLPIRPTNSDDEAAPAATCAAAKSCGRCLVRVLRVCRVVCRVVCDEHQG